MKLDYFFLKLTHHIASEFPDRIDEKEMIQQRSELASATYHECTRQGLTHTEALMMANETLFDGFNYSPYQLVKRVVEDQFPDEDEAEQDAFTLQMLDLCKPLFEEYDTEDPAFPGSQAEMQLYICLTGEIDQYLKKNGMTF